MVALFVLIQDEKGFSYDIGGYEHDEEDAFRAAGSGAAVQHAAGWRAGSV